VRSWRAKIVILSIINKEIYNYIIILSSKGIEPFTAINQFFYRESPLPIGSPALNLFIFIFDFYFYLKAPGLEPELSP
jgi:hypothetical protein